MNRSMKVLFKLLDIFLIFLLTFGSPMSAFAQVWTNPTDFPPGSIVTIRGDNSDEDNANNFSPGETVHVDVVGPNGGYFLACDGVADENGAWQCDVTLSSDPAVAVGEYVFTATGQTSGNVEVGIFTDANPSADLDQCANDESPSPSTDGCDSNANQWVNGNLNQAKSVYLEGDSIPYRMRFESLSLASHTVTIKWDTTKSGKHAIDYLTTFNQTVANANPCLGVGGCGAPTTFPIPADLQVTGAGVTPIAGNFTMYGGTITAVSAYSYPDGAGFTGDKSAQITITFTASQSNPVLAWGGHIATRTDWGLTNSAISISGSPYHTSLIGLDGSGGNQDRSLSAEAVIFPAKITIIKDAVPDDAQDFSYTTTGAGLSSFSLDDDADGTLSNTQVFSGLIDFSTKTVTEADPLPAFALTNLVCVEDMTQNSTSNLGTRTVTIALEEGEAVTCTFTNTQQTAELTLIKTVVNDNGGTALADDFQAYINGNPVPWNSAQTVGQGSYTASEDGVSGYTASTWGGDCAADGSITLVAGQSKTCSITNDDIAPTLTLVKTVVNDNGGTAAISDFPLFINGNPATSGTAYTLSAGSYLASETNLAGYTASVWGGDCAADGSVTLNVGDNKTCTITNNDQAAFIIVEKVVINNSGGSAAPDDFNLTLDGNATTSGAVIAVNPGTYTAGETQLPGYTFEGFSGGCDSNGSITVALGETKTCTLTNNDQQAYVIVEKVVITDNGGTALPNDFNLTLEDNTTTSGTLIPVNPGTYTAGETQLPGYTFAGFSGDCDANGDVTVALGETKTCTLTNNDQAAYIIVEKVVINDNGGSAQPDDFNLTLEGNATTSGALIPVNPGTYTAGETLLSGYTFTGFSGDCDTNGDVTVALGETKTCTLTNNDQQAYVVVEKVVINNNGGSAQPDDFNLTLDGNATTSGALIPVNPGTYTAGETQLAGYTFTGFSGDCDTNGDVTVALGETKTCTLTNNDQQAYVIVEKVVINNNGGSAQPDDFNLTLEGNATTSGTLIPVDPGTYTAGETQLAGYTFTGFSGDCDTNGDVTVALGETKTCTLTNNDQQAYVIVEKVVINNNGGSAQPNDFNLTLDGNATTSGALIPVNPGTHTAGETQLAGYTFEGFSGDCDINGDVTVALGETKTCTLTNNDQQAFITVIKIVNNTHGGTAAPNDFNLTLEGSPISSGVAVPVNPGTYTAGETLPSGYTFSGFSGDCDANGDVTVALGESKTCTLTNNDQQAYITVVKVVINDNGGSAQPNDFNLTLEGNAVSSGVSIPVNPGTYTAGETLLSGYTFEGFSGDCDANGDVTVALGESKTCTLTNNDQQAYITVVKVVNNTHGGTAAPNDFNLTLEGNAVSSGVAIPVNPGTYTAGETLLSGYTFAGFSGDCDLNGDVTVALGESKTCTLTNNDQQAYITVVKVVTNDNGGSATPNDFNLTLEGNAVSSGVAVPVNPGTYTAGETLLSGYTFEGFSGDCDLNGDTTVALGESKTCTLTNNDQQAYVVVEKVVINNNGGSAQPDDFNLTLDGNATTSGTLIPVNPGTYTAGETQLTGYTFTGFSGDCDTNGDVTVALGETKTCTLTNNDQQAYVIVEKVVINNNGGSAQPNDFNLTLEGNAVSSGVAVPVNPGTYTAGETLLSGYTFTGFSSDCDTNGDVTVALGETKTCTLTNNDQQAYITVVKVVINDNGGSAQPNDFNLTLEGNVTTSGTLIPVNPGTYTAGETQLAGYTFTGFSGDCDTNGDVTVALGETKTCTLTNNDQQAYITVVKVVTNDNGGTAQPNDFNLTLEGNAVSSGVAVPVNPGTYTAGETLLSGYSFEGFSGDCDINGDTTVALGQSKTCTLTNNDQQAYITVVKVVTNDNGGTAQPNDFKLTLDGNAVSSGVAVPVNPGTYTAGETLLSGYGFEGFSGDCDINGDVTVALGQSKTCTLTNNDIQPKLTLVKIVINDNGGTKQVSDFPLFVNGSSVTSGVANGFNAGSYTASETTKYGYTASAWGGDCAANGAVTLNIGDNKTCTITNNDQPGTIIVQKLIKPTGSLTSFSFQTTGTGYNNFSLAGGQINTQTPLNAGSYTVKELVPLGWVLTGIGGSSNSNTPYNCTVSGSGGSTGVGDLNTQTATINLKNGDTVTCVFENTGQGVTRTQGFWATHPELANIAWFGGTAFGHTFPGVASVSGIGDKLICGRPIDTLGKLTGGFWSDISKKSDGKKRTALDQARMQLLQQLLAAELNASAFGTAPSSGSFAAWESALCGTNTSAIKTAQQQAASFNTAGDSGLFTPGTSANSKYARSIANYSFWNIIKP